MIRFKFYQALLLKHLLLTIFLSPVFFRGGGTLFEEFCICIYCLHSVRLEILFIVQNICYFLVNIRVRVFYWGWKYLVIKQLKLLLQLIICFFKGFLTTALIVLLCN
jgi:hypothetical protein